MQWSVVEGRDLRYVNQFILLKKFKYECLNIVPQLFVKVISSLSLILSPVTIMWISMKIAGLSLVFHGVKFQVESGTYLKCSPLASLPLTMFSATPSFSEALERHGSTLHCIHR